MEFLPGATDHVSTGTWAAEEISLKTTREKRFTIDGSLELEGWLTELCEEAGNAVRKVVPPNVLEGMLLGGGYGRGEGGVLRTEGGDRAYNDLEFYLLLKGSSVLVERQYQPNLHECAEELSAEAGIDVEFKACSIGKLRRSGPSMFYYDLVMGHRWVIGSDALLQGCEHHRNAKLIPASEATRLLMNRCSGLLFAKEHLLRSSFNAEDADFVGRNIAKAELTLGDVVLTVHGQYHWSCLERNRRLKTVVDDAPWLPQVQEFHDRGVAFKLHPVQTISARDELLARWETVARVALSVWLWLESRRLGKPFRTAEQYTLYTENKCPEVPVTRAVFANARAKRWDAVLRYPRDRVLSSLPALLWCWNDSPQPGVLAAVQRQLGTSEVDFSKLVFDYKQLWSTVN
jgi:hypothetical protein